MDAAHQVPQFGQGIGGHLLGIGQHLLNGLLIIRQHLFGQAQTHAQRHKAGLRTVVQISFDPTQLTSLGVDGLGSRRRQVRDASSQSRLFSGTEQEADHQGVEVGQRRGGLVPEQEEHRAQRDQSERFLDAVQAEALAQGSAKHLRRSQLVKDWIAQGDDTAEENNE
jgi:hypothetical protein